MKKKYAAVISWITAAISFLGATGCGGGASVSVSATEYHAEFGESFVIPDPVIKNGNAEDVIFQVTDSLGNIVTKAQLGSFYPEIGEYTLTFTLGESSATAKIVCSDTKGPTIEYADYTKTVFEGETFSVPTFVSEDVSGIREGSETLKIYKGKTGNAEASATEGRLTAEKGAEAYRFVYSAEDIYGNTGSGELITEVKEDFVDDEIEESVLWDFDEPEYINLIGDPTVAGTKAADCAIVTAEPAGVRGGALRLSCSENGAFAGLRLLHGKTVNTGEISRLILRLYADNDVTIFSVNALREDLPPIEFADLEKNKWHELEINPRALYPDACDVSALEISFRNTGTTNVYIDEIRAVPFYRDSSLADGCLGDFDEEGYLANIEQAGYDIGKGLISAEYAVIEKADLPAEELREGATGSVLQVKCNDVWTEDYGGYGVLGDGVKYYLPRRVNTSEINQLFIKIFCAEGADLALSFCYDVPGGKVMRSKARWLRGVENDWTTISISYEQIMQIVPMYEVTDDNNQKITDFDLTAIIITSCGNVPDHTVPCTEFYLDNLSFAGDFTDEQLAEGCLGDFDEEGYIARLDQAWADSGANTAVYEVLADGDEQIPDGARGGVVKVLANQADTAIFPFQGSRGDGVRFYLFEPAEFDEIESITIRAYGAVGKGTAVNVGFLVERNGKRIVSNAWWQQITEGRWGEITLDRQRLTLTDEDPKTGEAMPRMQDGDKILAVRVWACAVQSGLDWAKEFYIDEITFTTPAVAPEDPILPENCLIDFTDENDLSRISQSMFTWGAQANGGARYNIVSRENESNAAIYGYEWFNNDTKKEAFRNFTGSVLEVIGRKNTMDGATVSLRRSFELDGAESLKLSMFAVSNYDDITGSDGYIFYIEDSAGKGYQWRIHSAGYTGASDYKYALYQWTTLKIPVSELSSAGLKDISKISFVYGSPNNNDGYLYVQPITFTKFSDKPILPENCLIDFTDKNDLSRISQSDLMWSGQQNGGARYTIVSRENESSAAIYGYEWFNNDTKKEAFRNFTGSVLEVVSRSGKMDGAKVTFDESYSYSGKAALELSMFSASANGGYVIYVEDSAGTSYTWRINTTDYTPYHWTKLSLPVSKLSSEGLKDIAAVSFAYACGANDSYVYFGPICFSVA